MSANSQIGASTHKQHLEAYNERMVTARNQIAANGVVRFMCAPADADLLHLFLLYFCSLGVSMTEPVEGWIHRSGLSCEAMGLPDLGRALKRHALGERNHHVLMINDVKKLIEKWNRLNKPHLDVHEFLPLAPTESVKIYQQLHEDTIAGSTPYNQIAIEYEIEMLSVRLGPTALKAWQSVLGKDILECLSFITDHVELDVAHTRFNQDTLGALLRDKPQLLDDLVAAGERALSAYAGYLQDCLRLATHKRTMLTSTVS